MTWIERCRLQQSFFIRLRIVQMRHNVVSALPHYFRFHRKNISLLFDHQLKLIQKSF